MHIIRKSYFFRIPIISAAFSSFLREFIPLHIKALLKVQMTSRYYQSIIHLLKLLKTPKQMNPAPQESFSLESCQEDDFLLPWDSSYYERQCFEYEDWILNDGNQLDIESNPCDRTRSNSEIPPSAQSSEDNIEPSLAEAEPKNIVHEPSTTESSQSTQNEIYHYRNNRRKKEERVKLQKVYKIGSKFASANQSQKTQEKHQKLTSKLTKNLLAFGKKPILSYIRNQSEKEFFRSNEWFMAIEDKDGMNMEDYDRLYKCPEAKRILEEFFRKKVIDRELMLSRTTAENKIFYRYYLQVFERNFKKGSFKSISETMMEIQKQKKYL